MTVERRRLNSTSSPASVLTAPQRIMSFLPPQLLAGEDATLYEEVLARTCVAVKPVGMIEEMFVSDFVYRQWEIKRWRGLKNNFISSISHGELNEFLQSRPRI